MKRCLLAFLAALLGLGSASSPASAQFSYPLQGAQRYPGWQTPLSPYLNMLNPGNAAANYYIRVLPEFQRRQDRGAIYTTLQGLANQMPARPGAVERDIDTPLGSTGHPVAFGYTGGYFGGVGGVGGGMRGQAPRNPFPQRQAGPKNRWPHANTPQPAGVPPKKLQ